MHCEHFQFSLVDVGLVMMCVGSYVDVYLQLRRLFSDLYSLVMPCSPVILFVSPRVCSLSEASRKRVDLASRLRGGSVQPQVMEFGGSVLCLSNNFWSALHSSFTFSCIF